MDVKIRLPGILLVHDAVCLPSLRLSLMCTSRRSVYSPNPWNHKKIQDSISSSHGLNKPCADREGCCYTTCPQKHKLIHTRRKKTSYIPAFSQHRRTKLCCMRKSSTRRVLPLRIDKVVWFVEMVPARAWFLLCGAW